MSRRVFTACLLASLAACQAEGTGEGVPPESTEAAAEVPVVSENVVPQSGPEATPTLESGEADDSQCGADKLGRWLNVLPTETVKADIAETVGERPIRYYTQGDPITMDFSPARLNVELGVDGRIKVFRCG